MCLKQTPGRKRVHSAARTSHSRKWQKQQQQQSAFVHELPSTRTAMDYLWICSWTHFLLFPSLNVTHAGSLLSSFLSLFLVLFLIFGCSCLSFPLSRHRFFSCWNIFSRSPLSFVLSEGSVLFTFPCFLFFLSLKCNIRSVTFFVRLCLAALLSA